jgi:glycoside/pentoside/hexuronide:cation symporter, GPH family
MSNTSRISFFEKVGYGMGDAAANFVFMTMVLFQLNFYTDVYGLSASAAAAILFWPRIWDAVFDPIMGVLADRTRTRWGKFRPWILWTAGPWAIVMVLAYTTPEGWSEWAMLAYACITNMLLMTLYSMNNMPYAALGGVLTSDLKERTQLNAYRFAAVNVAQFLVGGLTLPLVAKFAVGSDRQHGWQMTMTLWAVLCLVLFLITFFTTKERLAPPKEAIQSPKQDVLDLIKNSPWKVMVLMTLVHFAILSFRGGAWYNYFHHYADKAAMYDFVEAFGLTAPALAPGEVPPGGLLELLGFIVHGDRSSLEHSNVADVYNSIVNVSGTATHIMGILLFATPLAEKFGKKAVAIAGFGLSTLTALALYVMDPTNVWGMYGIVVLGAAVYAPTIPLVWAMFADVADYSEWQTGRRFTGMVFATIGFALKAGLALGSASFLWLMSGLFDYDTKLPTASNAVDGYRAMSSLAVSVMFATCTVLLFFYQLDKTTTLKIAKELEAKRAA